MRNIGSVSSEGGPLLLADANTARLWHGVEEDGSDYKRACSLPDSFSNPGGPLLIGQDYGIIWRLGGAGTAHVFANSENQFLLVRAWLHSNSIESLFELAGVAMQQSSAFGELEIASGILAILWATESGECIKTLDVSVSIRPSGIMATESAGLLVSVPKGCYTCIHDEVQLPDGQSARRCHLINKESISLIQYSFLGM